LNILIYAGGFSEIGGIERFTVNLIKELSKFPVYISILNWGKYNSLLKEIEKMI